MQLKRMESSSIHRRSRNRFNIKPDLKCATLIPRHNSRNIIRTSGKDLQDKIHRTLPNTRPQETLVLRGIILPDPRCRTDRGPGETIARRIKNLLHELPSIDINNITNIEVSQTPGLSNLLQMSAGNMSKLRPISSEHPLGNDQSLPDQDIIHVIAASKPEITLCIVLRQCLVVYRFIGVSQCKRILRNLEWDVMLRGTDVPVCAYEVRYR